MAAMRLVEQGKLDMDTDINAYLIDFKVPGSSYGPITLNELMGGPSGDTELFERSSTSNGFKSADKLHLHEYNMVDYTLFIAPAPGAMEKAKSNVNAGK